MNKKLMSTMTVAGLATLGGLTEASADTKYTIENGDTLSHIALEYGTTVRQIAAQNNLANPDLIFAGETLWINGVPTQVRPMNVAPTAAEVSVQAPVVEAAPVQEAPKAVETPAAPVQEAPKAVEVEKPAAKPVAPKAVEAEKPAAPKAVEVEKAAPVQEAPAVPQAVEVEAPVVEEVQTPMFEQAQPQVQQQVAPVLPSTPAPVQPQVNENASVYDRFLNAGGTVDMWNVIVMPESGGIPDIVSPNGYRGLGQTKEAWGVGSVEEQTAGMLNYAQERYGSVSGAIAFRLANGWW